MSWIDTLDERQRKEIALARLYAKEYAHGTDGHHRLLLISRMAELLDMQAGALALARLRTPETKEQPE